MNMETSRARIVNEFKSGDVKLFEVDFGGNIYKILVTNNDSKGEDVVKVLKLAGVECVEDIVDYDVYIDYNNVPRFNGYAISQAPKITLDNECLVKKIESSGVEYEKHIRSGFAARNYLILKSNRTRTITSYHPELTFDGARELKEHLEAVYDTYYGLERFLNIDVNSWIYVLVPEIKTVVDYSNEWRIVKKLKEECEKEYLDAVSAEYGNIIEGVEFGPLEKFEYLPDEYVEIYSVRTKLTQDYRQGRSHTYAYWAIKKGTKGVITITLPSDAPIGKIIGKGGSRIKEKAKEIGCEMIKIKQS